MQPPMSLGRVLLFFRTPVATRFAVATQEVPPAATNRACLTAYVGLMIPFSNIFKKSASRVHNQLLKELLHKFLNYE